jgi:hypothetical protein
LFHLIFRPVQRIINPHAPSFVGPMKDSANDLSMAVLQAVVPRSSFSVALCCPVWPLSRTHDCTQGLRLGSP